MYSVKNVFWKFQETFFKNNCDWAYFLQSSRLLACNFTKNELLHKSFQGFFSGYQNILFPEQFVMGHSWQRVPNTSYVMKNPLYWLPTFLKFCPILSICCFQPSPPAIFDFLFLWLSGWSCHICVSHSYMQRYTQHTLALTHPYKCLLTPPVMCSRQLSVLHWIIHWYQKIIFHNVFSFKKLLSCKKCKSVH